MSDKNKKPQDSGETDTKEEEVVADDIFPQDVLRMERLAEFLRTQGLQEVVYRRGDTEFRLVAAGVSVGSAEDAARLLSQQGSPSAQEEKKEPDSGFDVPSPIVGTAYLSPEPGAPRYVNPGDRVEKGQTLLIVEAMKVMNAVASPVAGRILSVLASDGQPVEYGEILARIAAE